MLNSTAVAALLVLLVWLADPRRFICGCVNLKLPVRFWNKPGRKAQTQQVDGTNHSPSGTRPHSSPFLLTEKANCEKVLRWRHAALTPPGVWAILAAASWAKCWPVVEPPAAAAEPPTCKHGSSYSHSAALPTGSRPQLQRLTCSSTYSGKCRLHTCRPSSLQGILGYSSSFHLFSSGSKVRMESL